MDLESGKVHALNAELEQEKTNLNAIKLELDQEKVALDAMKTDIEQQKAALDNELAGHNATKRYFLFFSLSLFLFVAMIICCSHEVSKFHRIKKFWKSVLKKFI